MKKCQQCNRVAACCCRCGLCSLCGETRGSILNDELCAKCAGDPVVPDDPAWWEPHLEQADYSDAPGTRNGMWAGSLNKAIENAQNNRWNTPWDKLYEREVEHYADAYRSREGLMHLVECDKIAEEDVDDLLAASDPLDELQSWGIDIWDWIYDDARISLDSLAEEIKADDSDINVAIVLGMLPDRHRLGFWGAMMDTAIKMKRYDAAYQYQRMAAALHVMPTQIETELLSDNYNVHEVLGLCPGCLFPITSEMLLGDGEHLAGGDCWYCDSKYDLRQAALWWLHYQGLLTDDPEIFTAPRNTWILWPAEMELDVSQCNVLGEIAFKEGDL